MAPLMTNTSSLSKLEDIKQVIRCLLISYGSRDITLNKLNSIYHEQEDHNIPFKDFNFTSLKDFLFSMPEVVSLEWNEKFESYCAYHVDTKKSQHISSLVAKEKKRPNAEKGKSKAHLLKQQYNPVDPHILLEVLKALHSPKRNRISKEDVLAEIHNRVGIYSFYCMQGLNSQLAELFHLLKFDNDYIYFKNTILENNTSLQNTTLKNQNKIINDKACRKSVNLDSISWINDKVQERLRKLIEKYPNGIWCSELPKLYVDEFGFDLQYINMGFNSITEFVAALPHIFKIVIPSNTQKQMVVDARRDSNDLLTSNLTTSTPLSKSSENIKYDYPPHPSKLSPKVSKALMPENTMNYNETVDQISVSSLFMNSDSCVDVIVTDVHIPSFFWVMLHENKEKLKKLMSQLENFYSQQDLNKYKVAKAVLQPGLNIACVYGDMWHRGIVKEIKADGVGIHFYDYGTIATYDSEEIYHLDKRFAALPAQAIPCGLYNIIPLENNKWESEVKKKFERKVFNKAFVASIHNIDEENNSMIINLIDTSSKQEVYITEWMIKTKMAKWGKSHCRRDNFAFKHYQECSKAVESVTDDKTENKISFVSIDLTVSSSPTYIDSKKQLAAITKYKAKLSNSSSTSLTPSTSLTSEDSASSISSASSAGSLNNDSIDEKQDRKDSDLKDECQENVNNPEFRSKDLSSSQSSLLSTDSFISNTSSDKSSLFTSNCGKLMFKSSQEPTTCNSSCSSSNRTNLKNNKSARKTVNNTLMELQKLIDSTK